MPPRRRRPTARALRAAHQTNRPSNTQASTNPSGSGEAPSIVIDTTSSAPQAQPGAQFSFSRANGLQTPFINEAWEQRTLELQHGIAERRQRDHYKRPERESDNTSVRSHSPASIPSHTPSAVAKPQILQHSVVGKQPLPVHLVAVSPQDQPVTYVFQSRRGAALTYFPEAFLRPLVLGPTPPPQTRFPCKAAFTAPATDVTGSPPVPWSLHSVAASFPYTLSSITEPQLPTSGPLKDDRWSFWLQGHPDRVFAATLHLIITRGVRLGYHGPRPTMDSESYQLSDELPTNEALDKDIRRELSLHRLSVHVYEAPGPHIASPVGFVRFRDGSFRRILDLSSVNEFIPKVYGPLEYGPIDDTIDAILRIGREVRLVKRGLADAFRHIPVAEADRWLLRFYWVGKLYEERFLPTGLRTSPFLSELFAKAVNWILIAALCWPVVIYHNEAFLAILPLHADAELYATQFDALCEDLGLSVNHEKSSTGTTAQFLCFEFDTIAMQGSLGKTWMKLGAESPRCGTSPCATAPSWSLWFYIFDTPPS